MHQAGGQLQVQTSAQIQTTLNHIRIRTYEAIEFNQASHALSPRKLVFWVFYSKHILGSRACFCRSCPQWWSACHVHEKNVAWLANTLPYFSILSRSAPSAAGNCLHDFGSPEQNDVTITWQRLVARTRTERLMY